MKVYVAGKFEDKSAVLAAHKQLRAHGHIVAYDWTTHDSIKPYSEHSDQAARYAGRELAGIADCDVFVYLANQSGTTLHMEFGAALLRRLMTGCPDVYTVGEANHSPWFFQPVVQRCHTFIDVLDDLKTIAT